jgi:hypothetical protein
MPPDLWCNVPESRWLSQEFVADVFHAATSIVYQNVEAVEAFESQGNYSGAVVLSGYIGMCWKHTQVATGLLRFLGDGLQLKELSSASRDDTSSGIGKPEHDRSPKSTSAACDDGGEAC